MFGFLRRRSQSRPFDLARIGDRWTRRMVRHDGRDIDLAVRELPGGPGVRDVGKFVALIQPEAALAPDSFREWTDVLRRALERDGKGLLVVVQAEPTQITWYAYAGNREAFDEMLLAQRATHPVQWGMGADESWAEYEFALKLVRT